MGYLHCHLDSEQLFAYGEYIWSFLVRGCVNWREWSAYFAIVHSKAKTNGDSPYKLVLGLATCAVETCNLVFCLRKSWSNLFCSELSRPTLCWVVVGFAGVGPRHVCCKCMHKGCVLINYTCTSIGTECIQLTWNDPARIYMLILSSGSINHPPLILTHCKV